MLTAPQAEPPKSGDVGWAVAIIAGVFSTIVAFIHRMRAKSPLPRIPTQNASEIFTSLSYLEKRSSTLEDSSNDAWRAIEELRADVREIKHSALKRRDLDDASDRLLRKMQEMLDSKA